MHYKEALFARLYEMSGNGQTASVRDGNTALLQTRTAYMMGVVKMAAIAVDETESAIITVYGPQRALPIECVITCTKEGFTEDPQ